MTDFNLKKFLVENRVERRLSRRSFTFHITGFESTEDGERIDDYTKEVGGYAELTSPDLPGVVLYLGATGQEVLGSTPEIDTLYLDQVEIHPGTQTVEV